MTYAMRPNPVVALNRASPSASSVTAYDRAIELTANPTERRFLERQRRAAAEPLEHL